MSVFFAHVARSSGSATDARRTYVVPGLREVERSGEYTAPAWAVAVFLPSPKNINNPIPNSDREVPRGPVQIVLIRNQHADVTIGPFAVTHTHDQCASGDFQPYQFLRHACIRPYQFLRCACIFACIRAAQVAGGGGWADPIVQARRHPPKHPKVEITGIPGGDDPGAPPPGA